MQKLNYIILCCMLAMGSFAQKDTKAIYDGNNLYHVGRFSEASAAYAKALKENPNNKKANFNLGTAIYNNAKLLQAGKISVPGGQNIPLDSLAGLMYDKSAEHFAVVANSVSSKDTLHQAWHNIGNCFLGKKDYGQAVSAYKKALKYDPTDEDTRYNLAYALKHLPPEKKNGGGGQQQQQQQQQKDNKDQKQQQKPQEQMSKEQAEQLLKAMMEAEKKQQDKRRQKQEDPSINKMEKDW